MIYRPLLALLALLTFSPLAFAQAPLPVGAAAAPEPTEYEILDVRVEGAESEVSRLYVLQNAGLVVGQRVTIPGDDAFSEAIRQLYQVGIFSDIQVLVERTIEDGAFLVIRVQEEPRLGDFQITGLRRGQRDDIRQKIPIQRGRAVKPGDVERTRQVIRDYLAERGFRAATVEVHREMTPEGRVNLTFDVDRGSRVRIADIRVFGNEHFSDGRIRGLMKNTREASWWRFWRRSRFEEAKYREDLQNIIDYYNERGFYDARIVRDTVYTVPRNDDTPDIVVEIEMEEGNRYYIRDIVWEGNTEYTNTQLTEALGFSRGDVFNSTRLERNLYGNPQSTDVASLYLNRGYMRFNATPTIVEVPGDSLDIFFEVHEGDVYQFGNINIVGNTKTKDHVIRRELRTLPGTTFSRDAIQRSLRELAQLNYFDPEHMIPDTRIDEDRRVVDLTYRLEETGSDQLEFSGGWGGGALGVLLQTRVTFNNFSAQNLFKGDAWRPLPSGDGQQLSLGVQVGGRSFQSYSLSFQEPWFRGRPNPIGFALSHSRYDYSRMQRARVGLLPTDPGQTDNRFSTTSARVSYGHRLSWPDDFFRTNTVLGYRLYHVGQAQGFAGLPSGTSQEMTILQSIGRNSFDNPLFPSIGSSLNLSVEVAPPLSGFIQYHKWRMNTAWAVPVWGRLSLSASADYGYLGSLTGDRVDFQRFLIGGTPLQAQYGYYGKDLVFMRGYPIEAISPVQDGQAIGGSILNKYSAELRLLAVQSPQFQLAPYLFMDAANTWNDFRDYNPGQLYRAAGVGARIFLPIIGMLELSYGYNFDEFLPRGGDDGSRKWRFQFSLGQGFGL